MVIVQDCLPYCREVDERLAVHCADTRAMTSEGESGETRVGFQPRNGPNSKVRAMSNIDPQTVASFGDEWSRFDQAAMSEAEAQRIFGEYFAIFPWDALPLGAEGFDMGCGSGRWARWVAPKVGRLHCIDPSGAIEVAKKNLAELPNVSFYQGSVNQPGLAASSQDFGYSLGVLHHIPDTQAALRACVDLLKPDAPFLVYLYYAFDNRPAWFRTVWRISDGLRRVISRLPARAKHLVTGLIALLVYVPLARTAWLLEKLGIRTEGLPLHYYRRSSFYVMRTDARDRFGTPLERRFTRDQVTEMMHAAGLRDVRFSEAAPYWCAVGLKQPEH